MGLSDRDLNKITVEELEEALYRKKQAVRQRRLERLKVEGRVVDVRSLSTVDQPVPTPAPTLPHSVNGRYRLQEPDATPSADQRARWKLYSNRLLLLVEVGAVIGIIAIVYSLIGSVRELNSDAAIAQQGGLPAFAAATATPQPLIDLVVLPTGHRPPVEGQPISFEEAGFIPEHLIPAVEAYKPPEPPPPSDNHPRQIEIASINVDAPIVQGHEPEQLKKGVGHTIGTGLPGEQGNMVLSAHNDIYGQLFRHLDKLAPGDEVTVSTSSQEFTYIIREIFTVDPTDVWVMDPTEHAQLTLISCYPYLVNNKRIIVFADLKGETLPQASG